jgi:hypothetical protein
MVVAHHQAKDPEVEIKLEFNAIDAARLAAHPMLRAAPENQDLVSIYSTHPAKRCARLTFTSAFATSAAAGSRLSRLRAF